MDLYTSPQEPWLCLQNLSVDNVRNLLGQNVGDLQKARSHPNVILWMHSHNMSDLSEMGLDTSPTLAYGTSRPPANTVHLPSDLNLPGNDGVAPTSGMVYTPVPILTRPLAVPASPLPSRGSAMCHRSLPVEPSIVIQLPPPKPIKQKSKPGGPGL